MKIEIEIPDSEFSDMFRATIKHEINGGSSGSPIRKALFDVIGSHAERMVNVGLIANLANEELTRLTREIAKDIAERKLREIVRKEVQRQLIITERSGDDEETK